MSGSTIGRCRVPGTYMDSSQCFDCLHCGRSFGTRSGLGLHLKRSHPVAFNAAIVTERARPRWTDEEVALLASEELRLRAMGYNGNINRRLSESFPGRSADAVKGARAKVAYRRLLERLAEYGGPRPAVVLEEPVVRREVDGVLARGVRGLVGCLLRSNPSPLAVELIAIAKRRLEGSLIGGELAGWVTTHLAAAPRRCVLQDGVTPGGAPGEGLERTDWRSLPRRVQYGRVQELWKRDRRAAVGDILAGGSPEPVHDPVELGRFWKPILETESEPWPGVPVRGSQVDRDVDLWGPVTMDEVCSKSPALSSAAGLDRVSPSTWRGLPWRVRALVLDLIMMEGSVPPELLRARVTMLPKVQGDPGPGDYRPIAVASVVVRHLHRILAARLEVAVTHVPEQAGFRKGFDGVAGNVFALDFVLRTAWRKKRRLVMSVLDVRKAFDSVSHAAILAVLRARGVHEEFCAYIEALYRDSTSVIAMRGMESEVMRPARGVRQGDPLSPILFNMVMDHVIGGLSEYLGFNFGGTRIRALAYADDLVLLSTTDEGMQRLLAEVVEGLGHCGLELNPAKSRSLTLLPSGARKLLKLDHTRKYYVEDTVVGTIEVGETWDYLGVRFGPTGVVRASVDVSQELHRIDRAPLKPQQKVEVVRTFLWPSLLHPLVFARPDVGLLRGMDVQVRGYVRKWLHLPKDVPNALIHAPVRFGGLGIHCLRTFIPYLREKRFLAVWDSLEALGVDDGVREVLGEGPRGQVPPHPGLAQRDRLVSHVDGYELREAGEVPASTAWIAREAGDISGREYVQFIRLYAGALPTRMRLSRGRRVGEQVLCAAGCRVPETAAHVVNHCRLVAGGVILRHHAVVNFLTESLRARGLEVFREPTLTGPAGTCRPDLVAYDGATCFLLDVTIASGQVDMTIPSLAKKRRYGRGWVYRAAEELLSAPAIRFRVIPVTLTWKGIWSKEAASALRAMGIPMRALSWITQRVIRGSHMSFNGWRRRTAALRRGGAEPGGPSGA